MQPSPNLLPLLPWSPMPRPLALRFSGIQMSKQGVRGKGGVGREREEPFLKTALSWVGQRFLSDKNLCPIKGHFPGGSFSPINFTHVSVPLTNGPGSVPLPRRSPQAFAQLIGHCLVSPSSVVSMGNGGPLPIPPGLSVQGSYCL